MTAQQAFIDDYRAEYKNSEDEEGMIAPTMVSVFHRLLTSKKLTTWNY